MIAEHGITGLTHRKVAAAAGVPLGSTTYHFATLDDLLAAALGQAASRSVAKLRAWEEALHPDADLAVGLADFVITSIGQDREDTMAEYNLYALALHRPALRQAAVDWDDALSEVLQKRTDSLTGHMLGIFLCGLIMQAVLRDNTLTRSEIEAFDSARDRRMNSGERDPRRPIRTGHRAADSRPAAFSRARRRFRSQSTSARIRGSLTPGVGRHSQPA